MSATTVTDNTTGGTGFITVSWTSADEGPNHFEWRLYQRSGNKPWTLVHTELNTAANYTVNSYAWANAITQEFVAVAVEQDPLTGALTEAPRTGAGSVTPPGDTGYTLVHPTDPTQTVPLPIVTQDDYQVETEHEVMRLLGDTADQGGGFKINRGYSFGRTGSLTAEIYNSSIDGTATYQLFLLEQAHANATPYFLRDPFGNLLKIFIGNISVNRVVGVGDMEAVEISFPYTQVI